MAKKRSSRITAAAAPVASATVQVGGIRSAPTQNLWRNWRAETPAIAQERVKKSRFLQEALPFIGYLVSQLPEEALGDGLVPTSESKSPTFKKAATQYFDAWARSPAVDIRRRFDFYTSQGMIAQTMIGDGEVFALKIKDDRAQALAQPLSNHAFRRLQLQFLTRDQLGNSGFRDLVANGTNFVWDAGVKFDALDIPQAYRILKQSATSALGSIAYNRDYDERPASQMLHIFADRHLNQRHGTPWLFSGDNSLFDSIDLRAVEKYANKIRAYFVGAITTQSGDAPAGVTRRISRGTDSEGADNGLRYIELAGGVSFPIFKEGEKIEFFHGQAYSMAEIIARCWNEACFCLKFPPEYLINIAQLGSASVRMVLRKVKKALDRIRRPIREQYCQAIWEFVIGDAIERGEPWTKDEKGKIIEDWRSVTWKGGVDPSIDAGRDEAAEQNKIRSGIGTVEAYCDALGLDGETVRHARLDEIADNIAYGTKNKLPWFLCIDPLQVQAITGLASSLGVDVGELVKQIQKVNEG